MGGIFDLWARHGPSACGLASAVIQTGSYGFWPGTGRIVTTMLSR
jgi:hypothetical protein